MAWDDGQSEPSLLSTFHNLVPWNTVHVPRPLSRGGIEEGLGQENPWGRVLDLVLSFTQKLPNGHEVPSIAAAVRVQSRWGPAGR